MAKGTDPDGFTRLYAVGLVWTGWTMVGATVLGAVVIGLASGGRAVGQAFGAVGVPDPVSGPLAVAVVVVAGAVLGLWLGTPFIVAGELILVTLDQRRLLEAQGRTLRRIRRQLDPRPPARPVRDQPPTRFVDRLSPH